MAQSTLNILVVEDHADTLEVLGWFLEELGYRCKLASSAELAFDMAHAEKFDVLITDVQLGCWDGFELVAKMRRRGCLPARVFSMSAGDDRSSAARSKGAGCHRHLVKPMLSEELGALLQEASYAYQAGPAAERMTEAMRRDLDAQRPLIEARQRSETAEVFWEPDRYRRARGFSAAPEDSNAE